MGCNCGKSSGNAAETYVVRLADGTTKEVESKTAADILVTKHGGGSYSVKKK